MILLTLLKSTTKQLLNTDAVDIAITENPMDWTWTPSHSPDDSNNYSINSVTCYEQYIIDRNRCNRNNNVNAIGVAAAFLGGPVSGGLACLGAMWVSKNCLADAREDYYNCTH